MASLPIVSFPSSAPRPTIAATCCGHYIISAASSRLLCPSIRIRAPGAAHPGWVERGMELPYDRTTRDTITALLGRKWFTPLWIIQESRLAGRHAVVRAGSDVVPLSLLLPDKDRLPLPELRPKLEYVQRMTDDQAESPFCAVLDIGYARGCVDLIRRISRVRSSDLTNFTLLPKGISSPSSSAAIAQFF
ncbi:hypothetical protein MAPG_04454 [Magnaporthiopsis poae ATCC 64411]|uniref:Heterokaryon incompatibility domain-containing protein n=1 Tax=Magnaporthiopsis poae (strain ATCC 64411 / 73-15) TaxID=644358 RepID=A0A0C4DWS4_MAGP6|nr:hypothetical protein MAPG_04454 [Magnaporthiopsis poae ATCC 64411]